MASDVMLDFDWDPMDTAERIPHDVYARLRREQPISKTSTGASHSTERPSPWLIVGMTTVSVPTGQAVRTLAEASEYTTPLNKWSRPPGVPIFRTFLINGR